MIGPLSGLIFISKASPPIPGYELLLLVASGGVLALVWSLVSGRRQVRSFIASSEADPGEQLAATRAAEDVREVLRELQWSVREIEDRLDSRIRILEDRIAEAKRLERTLAGRVTQDPAPPGRGEGRLGPQLDETRSEGERASQVEVERLAEEGCDAAEISSLTGRPMGEVEVILALRRQQRSKST